MTEYRLPPKYSYNLQWSFDFIHVERVMGLPLFWADTSYGHKPIATISRIIARRSRAAGLHGTVPNAEEYYTLELYVESLDPAFTEAVQMGYVSFTYKMKNNGVFHSTIHINEHESDVYYDSMILMTFLSDVPRFAIGTTLSIPCRYSERFNMEKHGHLSDLDDAQTVGELVSKLQSFDQSMKVLFSSESSYVPNPSMRVVSQDSEEKRRQYPFSAKHDLDYLLIDVDK